MKLPLEKSNKYYYYYEHKYYNLIVTIFLISTMIVDIFRRVGTDFFPVLTNYVELIRNCLYMFIFIYMLYLIVRHGIHVGFMILNMFCAVLICLSYVINPNINEIMLEFILVFYSRMIPGYFFFSNLKNGIKFLDYVRVINIISIIYCILIITGDSNLYMASSYNLLIPALLVLFTGITKHKRSYIISAFFLFLVIFLYGARGALLCVLVSAAIFYMYRINKTLTLKGAIIIFISIATSCVFVISYEKILLWLLKISNSRTISLILSGKITSDSNRNVIYETIISKIKQNPFAFRGILSDRYYLYEALGGELSITKHPHNIVLEILFQFGIFVGIIILLIFSVMILKAIFKLIETADESKIILFSSIVPPAIVQLLFSGSYLNAYMFWMALGLMIYITKNRSL